MKNNYFLTQSSCKMIVYLTSLFLLIGSIVQAQVDYVTSDSGRTYQFVPDTSSEYWESQTIDNTSQYIKILELEDNEYPIGGLAVYCFGDANHNGKIEMYRGITSQGSPIGIRVYEFDSDLSYTVTDLSYYGLTWELTDIDNNGKADLIIQTGEPGLGGNGYLRIYESQDAYSFPSLLKYQVTIQGAKVVYYPRIVDTDLDGKKEVLLSANQVFGGGDLRLYEW